MSTSIRCPGCGDEYVQSATLQAVCPGCLFGRALEGEPPQPIKDTMASQPRFAPPKIDQLESHFPDLEILELLGFGGMSAVYKARDKKTDQYVALKILPREVAALSNGVERFSREAKTLAKLSHPGIVAFLEFGNTEICPYILMEFVDGTSLRQLIGGEPLDSRHAMQLVRSICATLAYAHDQGLVHRDIKPENILLTAAGHVKLVDFGLAKFVSPFETALTAPEQIVGTYRYMAPEQLLAGAEVDHRSDLYSLGIVFYEMLTGELPMGRFRPPSHAGPIDPRLDPIIHKALENEPGRRYASAAEISRAIERIESFQGDQNEEVVREATNGATPAQSSRFSLPGAIVKDLAPFALLVVYVLCLYHFFHIDGTRHEPSNQNYYVHRVGQPDPWLEITHRKPSSGLSFNLRFDTGSWALLLFGVLALYGSWRLKQPVGAKQRRFQFPLWHAVFWILVAIVAIGSGLTPDLHAAIMTVKLPTFGG